jgi:hypothetical protein
MHTKFVALRLVTCFGGLWLLSGGLACGSSQSDSPTQTGTTPDALAPVASTRNTTPAPLSGTALDLVGTWKCSSSMGASTMTLTSSGFQHDFVMGSMTRQLVGDIVSFSTETYEYGIDGNTLDGFMIIRILSNTGLIIASPGQFGRLSWRNANGSNRAFMLQDSYFNTESEAIATDPGHYSMWETYSKQASP